MMILGSSKGELSAPGEPTPSPDELWPFVHLRATFDSSTTEDESQYTHSISSDGAISSAQKKFGANSLYLNGSRGLFSSNFTTKIPAYTELDGCFELWFYPTSFSGASGYPGRLMHAEAFLEYDSSGYLYLKHSSTTLFTASSAMTLNSWNHIALTCCRQPGIDYPVFVLYLNGTAVGSISNYGGILFGIHPATADPSFAISGTPTTNDGSVYGYIDDLRMTIGPVTSGAVRYTSDFTPSSTRLAIIGTKQLVAYSLISGTATASGTYTVTGASLDDGYDGIYVNNELSSLESWISSTAPNVDGSCWYQIHLASPHWISGISFFPKRYITNTAYGGSGHPKEIKIKIGTDPTFATYEECSVTIPMSYTGFNPLDIHLWTPEVTFPASLYGDYIRIEFQSIWIEWNYYGNNLDTFVAFQEVRFFS